MFFCGMKMCLCCFISNSLFVKVLVTAEDFRCPTFIVSNDSILSRFVLGFLSSFGFGFLTFFDCLNLSFNSCPLVRFDTDRGLILYFSATWCKLILVRSIAISFVRSLFFGLILTLDLRRNLSLKGL